MFKSMKCGKIQLLRAMKPGKTRRLTKGWPWEYAHTHFQGQSKLKSLDRSSHDNLPGMSVLHPDHMQATLRGVHTLAIHGVVELRQSVPGGHLYAGAARHRDVHAGLGQFAVGIYAKGDCGISL